MKKTLSIILSAIFVLSFVLCGQNTAAVTERDTEQDTQTKVYNLKEQAPNFEFEEIA